MNEPGADKDRPEGGSESFPPTELRDYPSAWYSCGDQVTEQRVTLTVPGKDGETRLVHEVSVGVCESCGEQYLRAKVARALDELMASPPTRHESVPVWVFAASA